MTCDFSADRPAVGIVLGSGLSPLAARSTRALDEVPFADAGVPAPSVSSHRGTFTLCEWAGRRVLLMNGRLHLYEGHSAADVTAGVRWMAAQGIGTLILTNAAGCLNPAFAPGEWMMIADHLNLTGTSPLTGPRFHDMSRLYSPRLRAAFRHLAESNSTPLREGVYAGVRGPQYETPAEIHMLRTVGADAVGMSTVLEAIQARALGLEVAGFSCLTNWAAGLAPHPLDHAEVVAAGHTAATPLANLLTRWLATEHSASHP
jgi:purine-nucleoside phosphorylase